MVREMPLRGCQESLSSEVKQWNRLASQRLLLMNGPVARRLLLRGMDHITLLFLILALIVVGVVVMLARSSKSDPLDQNPMRGTTRRDGRP
jgi:hypothetical protein